MPTERSLRGMLAPYVALAAAATVGHLGYPASLWLLTRRRADPVPPVRTEWPAITVLIAAYREAAVMASKVDDTLANGYPGELEVLVVADDPATAAAARTAGATVLASDERRGKSAALREGFEAAKGELIVMTDANALLRPGSLAALARWFADPSVGAVAGEKHHTHGREGLYWRFESWLKRREARLGTTIGLVGECSAVRRSSAPAIPAWVVVDDFWLAIAVRRAGQRVAYEPAAAAFEPPAPVDEEWQRRTRIVAGALQMLWRERSALGPADPVLAYQIWGHRLWRMSGGPLAHLALVGLAGRRAFTGRTARPERVLAAGVLAAHVPLVAGALAGDSAPGPLRAVGQVGYLQAVALGGMVRLLRGEASARWPKAERRAA